MNDKKNTGQDREPFSPDATEHDPVDPTPSLEGHEAAVRGTSATPGEAGSNGAEAGNGVGLTDTLDNYDEGVEGRLGGETSLGEDDPSIGAEEPSSEGTDMDEFGDDGEPRLGSRDW